MKPERIFEMGLQTI